LGGQVVQLFHDGQANLTQVLDVDGTRRTLSYDGGHRLTQDLWGLLGAQFGYDGTTGQLDLVNQGLGVTTAVLPAALQGFANPVGTAGQAAGVLTNALGAGTTYTLDLLGRALAVQTADGGTQLWGRDVHGDPFLSVDPMGRVSYYLYSDQGDELAYLHPDGVSLDLWEYDPVFHHVLLHTDPMGRVTGYAYSDAGDQVPSEGRVFLWGSHVLKCFRQPSGNQELVLRAAEELGWPTWFDDPLPRAPRVNAKARLHDTIKALNRNQDRPLIHFRGDGTGTRVGWQFRWACSPRATPEVPQPAP
jgi:YD repeat-containing protein